MTTTALYPDLTPLERHILFLESITGKKISQLRYSELLKAHFPKKDLPKWKKKKEKQSTIINKLKSIWNQI